MKYLLTILVNFLITTLSAQTYIKGKVIDKESNQPLSYVNIGIPNQPIGTISNPDGSFSLYIDLKYQKDTLVFSNIGYDQQKISVQSAYTYIVVTLKQKSIQLQAVTVIGKKTKKIYDLGNKRFNSSYILADSAMAGSAMALLIENKFPNFHRKLKTPFVLKKAILKIDGNTFDQFKIRVRILDYDSLTGLPGKDLLEENIIITSRLKREGWIKVDLSQYNIIINQNCLFLVFEWILDDIDRQWLTNQYKLFNIQYPEKVKIDTSLVEGKKIPYVHWQGFKIGTSFGVSIEPFVLNNYRCFFRTNSQGSWNRSSAILSALLYVTN